MLLKSSEEFEFFFEVIGTFIFCGVRFNKILNNPTIVFVFPVPGGP